MIDHYDPQVKDRARPALVYTTVRRPGILMPLVTSHCVKPHRRSLCPQLSMDISKSGNEESTKLGNMKLLQSNFNEILKLICLKKLNQSIFIKYSGHNNYVSDITLCGTSQTLVVSAALNGHTKVWK